jgi:DNA-binding MarR family transcriptional regulator
VRTQAARQAEAAPRSTREINLGPLPGLAGYLIRRAQIAIFQDFGRTFASFGIRPAQYAALTIIEHNPGLKQTEIGSALGIKRANFVAMCDELEMLGLAERRSLSSDRRSNALFLTKKGERLMPELHRACQSHEARVTAKIGDGNKGELLEMLTAIATLGSGEAEE